MLAVDSPEVHLQTNFLQTYKEIFEGLTAFSNYPEMIQVLLVSSVPMIYKEFLDRQPNFDSNTLVFESTQEFVNDENDIIHEISVNDEIFKSYEKCLIYFPKLSEIASKKFSYAKSNIKEIINKNVESFLGEGAVIRRESSANTSQKTAKNSDLFPLNVIADLDFEFRLIQVGLLYYNSIPKQLIAKKPNKSYSNIIFLPTLNSKVIIIFQILLLKIDKCFLDCVKF